MMALALASDCRRLPKSSRIALASLSTRAGRLVSRANEISFALLHVGGGGGGAEIVTEVFDEAVSPRSSVAVQETLIGPGDAPAVSSVAVLPLPEIRPPLAR